MQAAAKDPLVLVDQGQLSVAYIDGVDPCIFRQGQGLKYFPLGIVSLEKRTYINQVAGVGPATDQVSPDKDPADLLVKDLSPGELSFQVLELAVAYLDGGTGYGID